MFQFFSNRYLTHASGWVPLDKLAAECNIEEGRLASSRGRKGRNESPNKACREIKLIKVLTFYEWLHMPMN